MSTVSQSMRGVHIRTPPLSIALEGLLRSYLSLYIRVYYSVVGRACDEHRLLKIVSDFCHKRIFRMSSLFRLFKPVL